MTSVPILFVGVQLLLGWRELHVPGFMRRWTLPTLQFGAVLDKVAPWLERAERLARPRLPALVSRPVERLIGVICIVLAVVLFLPIPLGNIPPGISITLLGLGLMEKDGRSVAVGLLATAVSLFIASGVLLGVFKVAAYAASSLLGR